MTVGRRPKRHNPNAERLTFVCELERCPQCGALQGYDQLVAISQHLNNRRLQNGPDLYWTRCITVYKSLCRGWRPRPRGSAKPVPF